jgi:signal transduction histidine kinase
VLSNAVRYAGRGPILVRADRLRAQWVLSVIDKGPGIQAERLTQLLDPVRRLELKERGIGLTLVQEAMRAMGGRLEAESRPGEGSEFRVVVAAGQQSDGA